MPVSLLDLIAFAACALLMVVLCFSAIPGFALAPAVTLPVTDLLLVAFAVLPTMRPEDRLRNAFRLFAVGTGGAPVGSLLLLLRPTMRT